MKGFEKNGVATELINSLSNEELHYFKEAIKLINTKMPGYDIFPAYNLGGGASRISLGIKGLGEKTKKYTVLLRFKHNKDKIKAHVSLHNVEWLRKELNLEFESKLYFDQNLINRLGKILDKIKLLKNYISAEDRTSLLPDSYEEPEDETVSATFSGSHSLNNAIDENVLRLIKQRRGQSNFRENLLTEFNNKCVISECDLQEVLEAAHIIPHSKRGDYSPDNGLLLRADLHTLFDLGIISIDENGLVTLLKNKCENNEYTKFNNKKIDSKFLTNIRKQNLKKRLSSDN